VLLRNVKKRLSLGLPFHIPSAGTASPGVRRGKQQARRLADRRRPWFHRVVLFVASFIGWPLLLAGCMREHVALHSQRASAAKDPPNVLYVYWYCLRHQLTAAEYFRYRLDDPEHEYNVDDYLFSSETASYFPR